MLYVTTSAVTLRAFLLPYATHFRRKGWKVDAMATGVSLCDQCVNAFDQVWEANWSRNPLFPQNLSKTPSLVRRAVAIRGYDIVHVHTPVASFVTRFALRHQRHTSALRVVYTAHGFHFYRGGPAIKNAVFIGLEMLAGRWTDYLVVINHEDKEAAHHYQVVPSDRIRYMPGIGVNTALYRPNNLSVEGARNVRRELGLCESDSLFLMIGEFNPGKRHEDALRAFARLSRPDAHLAFAGEGPLEGKVRQLAQRIGVCDQVHFLGFRHDIPLLFHASVATVLPSEREGLPRSIMESMSAGVPVIGTDIRGIRDLLEGDCGLLVPVGDTDALAAAMAWVLENSDKAAEIGARGQTRIADYDLSRLLTLHEALYEEALGLHV